MNSNKLEFEEYVGTRAVYILVVVYISKLLLGSLIIGYGLTQTVLGGSGHRKTELFIVFRLTNKTIFLKDGIINT
jgi:hypothetical protein